MKFQQAILSNSFLHHQARLDKVAEAGLPMWITELSLIEANVTKKGKACITVNTPLKTNYNERMF